MTHVKTILPLLGTKVCKYAKLTSRWSDVFLDRFCAKISQCRIHKNVVKLTFLRVMLLFKIKAERCFNISH